MYVSVCVYMCVYVNSPLKSQRESGCSPLAGLWGLVEGLHKCWWPAMTCLLFPADGSNGRLGVNMPAADGYVTAPLALSIRGGVHTLGRADGLPGVTINSKSIF